MDIKLIADPARQRRALSALRRFAELADLALAEGNAKEATRCIDAAYRSFDRALGLSGVGGDMRQRHDGMRSRMAGGDARA